MNGVLRWIGQSIANPLWICVGLLSLWLAGVAFDLPLQRKVVQGEFRDYHITSLYAEQTEPYACPEIQPQDKGYPPFALLFTRLFPASNPSDPVHWAAWLHSGVGAVLLILATVACVTRYRLSWFWVPVAAVGTPALHSLVVGNLILHAAAGCLLFTAWYDDPSRKKRLIALGALAFAICLKLTPVLFTVLLLRERRFREFLLLGVVSTGLFFGAFFFLDNHLLNLPIWLENAAANNDYYRMHTGFGIRKLHSLILRILNGGFPSEPWPGLRLEAVLDAVIGGIALILAFLLHRRSAVLFAVFVAMCLIPSNALKYCAVYALPAFLVLAGEREASPSLRSGFLLLGTYALFVMPMRLVLNSFCASAGMLLFVFFHLASLQKRRPIMNDE